MQNKILVEVKDLIKSRLEEYKGSSKEASTLIYLLLESEIGQESYTCNAYESKEWIKSNFDELGSIINDYSINNDEKLFSNPLTDPELFQVDIMVSVGDYMLNKCSEVKKYGDDEMILTDKQIDEIKRELDTLDLSEGLIGLADELIINKKEDYGMEM